MKHISGVTDDGGDVSMFTLSQTNSWVSYCCQFAVTSIIICHNCSTFGFFGFVHLHVHTHVEVFLMTL